VAEQGQGLADTERPALEPLRQVDAVEPLHDMTR
jgi:hypothetical protein